MRIRTVLRAAATAVFCVALCPLPQSRAQQPSDAVWTLPHGLALNDAGPRTYKFVVDYYHANSKGEIIERQRMTGEYTRGLPGGEVVWKNVTQATAQGETVPFGPAEKHEFMEGFRYRNDLAGTMSPDFFRGFPPTAVMDRNLVWDTGMIETFGQNHFDDLKLNEPYHVLSNQDVNMPGVGTFRNHDVVLRWVGRSRRNSHDCAIIQYQAFFNPIEISVGGMTMKGRSDYWGEIWVSLTTKQIEYATLQENVLADMQLPGQNAPQLVNVFRIGTLEPVSTK